MGTSNYDQGGRPQLAVALTPHRARTVEARSRSTHPVGLTMPPQTCWGLVAKVAAIEEPPVVRWGTENYE